jgi:hypothetical protein
MYTTISSPTDGPRTVMVSSTDRANLTTDTTYSYIVDRTPPTIELSAISYIGDVSISGNTNDLNARTYIGAFRLGGVSGSYGTYFENFLVMRKNNIQWFKDKYV